VTITIDATYEGGVLKPQQPLPLNEHEMVRVTVEPQTAVENDRPSGLSPPAVPPQPSAMARIIARAEALPPEVVASWPTDGAAQHDHYLYGKPKRSE